MSNSWYDLQQKLVQITIFILTEHLFHTMIQQSSFDIFIWERKVFAELNSAPIINESTLIKMIGGLDETVGVILDYLQDAKVRV